MTPSILSFTRYATLIAVMAIAGQIPAPAAEGPESSAEKQRKLIEILKSDAPPAEKAITCKRLAVYGTKDAVPALAPLLLDEHLSSWARIALEAIPDPAAAEALRNAMGKVQGRLLIGVINSIGYLRDAKATNNLVEKLKDADAGVASAAAVALGHIGGDPSIKALQPLLASAPDAVRSAVAEGCILCAERLLAEKRNADAVKLYDAVRNAKVSKPRTIEATRGAILARGAAGVPLLVEQLRSGDRAMFNIGVRVARELRVPEVTKALLAELDRSSPDRQVVLLLAMADRGDVEALPAALKAVKSGPPQLRIEAISVLERLGNPAAVPVLLAATAEDDAELAQTAKLALTRLPGAEVDAAVVSALKQTDEKTRLTAIELIGQRRVVSAIPALMKTADDADESVRVASIKVIGDMAGDKELPTMIGMLLKSKSPAEMDAAERAVSAICIRQSKPVAGNVVIKKAVYGALPNGPMADVTQKVTELVKGGAVAVEASNTNFGDTAQGVPKSLRIEFSVEGTTDTKIAKEGESIKLTAAVTPPATVDALCAALTKAPTQPKLALLRVLRSTRSPKSLAAVRTAATDANAEIKDASLSILCDWPTVDALPDVWQLAKTSQDAKFKILGLRGAIRLIPQQDVAVEKKVSGLKESMALAERTEERRLVLAELGNLASVDALAVVTPSLSTPDLKEEASLAAVAIAEKIVQSNPAPVAEAMTQVIKATGNQQVSERARGLLSRAK